MDKPARKKRNPKADFFIPIPGARVVLRLAPFLLLAGCSGAAISSATFVPPTLVPVTPTLPLITPIKLVPTLTRVLTSTSLITTTGVITPTLTSTLTPTGVYTPILDGAGVTSIVQTNLAGTSASIPTITETLQPSPAPTHDPADWQSLPVIPTISDTVLKIYAQGQKDHNNPHAFSKIGDCETSSDFFLADFDLGKKAYNLGSYQDLQSTIDYFSGSFARISLAAGVGYNASSALSAIFSDPGQCQASEIPLACEIRVHRPSFVLVMFGTNDYANSRAAFERHMRMIIEYSIRDGVVPILATKADNREGDMSINALIAKLAQEYDLPLWNYWAATQPLADHGLKPDGIHLTYFPNHFDDPDAMKYAFPVRNLTALQVLDALVKAVTEE